MLGCEDHEGGPEERVGARGEDAQLLAAGVMLARRGAEDDIGTLYCQLTGANVTADIFTSGVSKRWEAIFALAASLLALGFALLLAWRMWAGMLDQRAYDYTTTILQFPHWLAFIPILISLALLAVAALMTLSNAARDVKRG